MHFEHAAGGKPAEQRLSHELRHRLPLFWRGRTPRRPRRACRRSPSDCTPCRSVRRRTLPICATRSGLPIRVEDVFPLVVRRPPGSPPTMMESDALMAPISPPLTGASSITVAKRGVPQRPACASTPGAMLLVSIRHSCPAVILHRYYAARPFEDPLATSGESGSIVMMRVARPATSAGEGPHARAPDAATSASTGAWPRLWTTRWKNNTHA